MPDCKLCDLQQGIIVADEYWTMALNMNQATLGRVFFKLNRHETDVTALTVAERDAYWPLVARAKKVLDALFAPDHYNYMFLMNLDPHVHGHIFPRYREPRSFGLHTFTDSKFGGHYDPDENRALDSNTQTALVTALKAGMEKSRGARL